MPRRARRPRLLLLGCGDIGRRIASRLGDRMRLIGVVRQPEAAAALRAERIVPLVADLDRRATLARLRRLATAVIHLAPPPPSGTADPRTRRALAAVTTLRRRGRPMVARGPARPVRWVYVSTTGVYGDRGGRRIDERTPVAPGTDRARRRVDAERRLRAAAARGRIGLAVLRAPGIYAADRLPLERLRAGVPALVARDDVHTNHIHALDLARACVFALARAGSGRTFNAVDASGLAMGDWFDRVADAAGLTRPPRLAREDVERQVSPAMLTFLRESRRVSGERLTRELRMRLRYPTVDEGLAAVSAAVRAVDGEPRRR